MKNQLLSVLRSPAIHLSSSGCAISLGTLVQHPCPIHAMMFFFFGLSMIVSLMSTRFLKWMSILLTTSMLTTSMLLLLPMMNAHAATDTSIRQIPIDYQLVATELQHSSIPVRVPHVVIYQLPPNVNRAFYVARGSVESSGYSLTIGHKDCSGANTCTIAIAAATAITSDAANIDTEFSPTPEMIAAGVERSSERDGWVKLANGQMAYFSGWIRAASMGYSYLTWDEGNVRYTLGLKGGKQEWLVEMANLLQK